MTYHHLSVLVHRQAEKYGDKVALKYRDYETAQWIPISWKQFSGTVRQAANAFVALGVEEQENIGIFSQNKPEWFYVDFGAFANRAVTIPFYATSSPAQAQYIINDAQIRFLFVGEQYQYDAAFSIFGFCSSLQQLIIFDRSVVKDPRDVSSIYFDEFMATGEGLPHNDTVEERTERASYDDLANILYTSGTTGELLFTETSIGTWNSGRDLSKRLLEDMKEVALGTINNWCRGVIVWNLMLDNDRAPNREGGCQTCYGAVDISNSDYKTIIRNSHYYIIAHLSSVVKPGAVRIGASGYADSNIMYSAFENPDGTYAFVLMNNNEKTKKITLSDGKRHFAYDVPGKSVTSYRWVKSE